MIHIDREITHDYERASGLEWLETNGLGGWAGTTVAGAHSRRYHGLLVAATEPPSERTVLLSRLDETLHLEGTTYELSCNQFPGVVAPRGFEHLTSFHKDLFPVFEFEAGGVRLRKTVAAVDGENTTLVLYEVLEAPGSFILSLRPFLAARDQHALSSANPRLSQDTPFEDGVLHLRPYEDVPEVFLSVPGADFRPNPQWWYRFEYEKDRRQGAEFQEDLWTPGVFGRELAPGDRLGIVISTRAPEGRDAFALFEKERKRREKIVKALPVQDDFARFLALVADGFVVRRGPSQRAVVAGYPGFGERGRDTMIALPGLCLVTGRHEDAKKILRAFAKSPLDTAADAPLWLFVASWKYLQATGDEAFVRETLLPALRKVAHACEKGKVQGIATAEGNALWYNAQSILAGIETRVGDPEEAKRLTQGAKRVQKQLQETIWDEEAENLLVLSLPFSPLSKPKAAQLLAAIEEKADPGTAWNPLLGSYLTALVRVHGAAGRKKALAVVEQLKPRLIEAGVGSLSEGVEALSVAEVLRAYVEDLRAGEKEKQTEKKPASARKAPVKRGR